MAKKHHRYQPRAHGADDACLECGAPIERKAPAGRKAHFCSPEHRKTWNNRRMTRGAILYDEVMKWRFDRANNPDAITTLADIAAQFRRNDELHREGRRSWIDNRERDAMTVAREAA